MRPELAIVMVVSALLVGGCTGVSVGTGSATNVATSAGRCGEPLAPEVGVGLSLVAQQRANRQLYRALASLQGLPAGSPSHGLLRADVLRELGRFDEAVQAYQALLTTCLRGQAYYGIALLHAGQQRVPDAEFNFRLAKAELPIDANLRNDYGFWLLAQGKDEAARAELLTALELNSSHSAAAWNLYFLLLKQRELTAAAALAQRYDWQQAELDQYRVAITHFTPLVTGELP